MRLLSLYLLFAFATQNLLGAEGDSEKLRALAEAKLKLIEKVMDSILKSTNPEEEKFESLMQVRDHFNRTKMELAKSPDERVALASAVAVASKSLVEQASTQHREGRIGMANVLRAELRLHDAELVLLRERKEDSAERIREIASARMKTLEKCVAHSKKSFEAGEAEESQVIYWTEKLNRTELELARTPDERLAVSEKILKSAMRSLEIVKEMFKVGDAWQLDVERSELNVIQAQIELNMVKLPVDLEKSRALNESKRMCLKKILDSAAKFRSALNTFEFNRIVSFVEEQLNPATTPEDRTKKSETRLKNAKQTLADLNAKVGITSWSYTTLYLAEIDVIEAEQEVLLSRKP